MILRIPSWHQAELEVNLEVNLEIHQVQLPPEEDLQAMACPVMDYTIVVNRD